MKELLPKPYGTGLLSDIGIGVVLAELSRIDLGIGTFFVV